MICSCKALGVISVYLVCAYFFRLAWKIDFVSFSPFKLPFVDKMLPLAEMQKYNHDFPLLASTVLTHDAAILHKEENLISISISA